ncbi:MAG: helix-turn-helix domain-containing protein [Candidatus Brocadiales bacterium]|nr:helix-turn-helix domain-containing protein [Candidatus Brocadiales bacterium]
MEQYFKPKEVASILKIGYHKVMHLIALGDLPAYKIIGNYRISESGIDEFLTRVKFKSYWKGKL